MNNKIVITLEAKDILALQSILIDEDENEALEFLKNNILPKVPNKGTMPCDSSRLNPYLFK